MADVKVVNRLTGKLETRPLEEADDLVARGGGYEYPSLDEIDRLERNERFGGQQGTAAVESTLRTATFGAWQGFGSQEEIEGRRQTLREESPGVAFATQAVGTALPAIATGGVAQGVLGAAGLGARAAGVAGAVAEGAAGGLAEEVEQAAAERRPVSAGRAMLVGIGGEIVGRAIPAAIGAGLGRLRAPDAAAAVAGEVVQDVSREAGKKARSKLAETAYEMPPGPDRDAALASTANDQFRRADAELASASSRAQELLTKLADDAPRALERNIEGTAPAQLQWSADVAAELRALAAEASEEEAKALTEAASALVEAKTGKAIWRAASDARKQLAETARSAPAVAPKPSAELPSVDELSRQFNAATGLPDAGARVRAIIDRRKQMSGRIDLGASVVTPRKLATAAEEMGLSESELKGFMMDNSILPGRGGTVIPSELHKHPKFQSYIDRIAIERYTENSAFKVNSKLRRVGWDKPWSYPGASAAERRYDEGLKGISKRAAEVMHRSPQQTKPIWRGLAAPEADIDQWQKQGFVTDKAFQSFSTREDVAKRFVPGENYSGQFAERGERPLLLHSPSGGGYHYGGMEAEAMFPPDTKLRILGTRQAPDGLLIIDVEPIPVSSASKGGPLSAADREAIDAVSGGMAADAGNVMLTNAGPNFSLRDLLTSPIGNVTSGAVGAAAGGSVGGEEGAIAGGTIGFLASLLLGRRAPRGLGRLARASERGSVELGGGVANDVTAGGVRRNAKGARLLDAAPAKGSAPDFSTWDPADFARGRGGGKAAGKTAGDYSGGATLSTYQRSIVDGLRKNAGFASTGRVTGDAGKLGSEPTFHIQPDGSVKLTHGRLRLTAARELGRETVYGRVVSGSDKAPETVFEGQIRVSGATQQAAPGPAAPGATQRSALERAEALLSERQADVGVWGRAGEGASDLRRSAEPGPGSADAVSALEDQLAAAQRWHAGGERTRAELAELTGRMRRAQDIRAETERAVAARRGAKTPAPGLDIAGAALREGAEFMLERAVGGAFPGAGLAVKGLWKLLDAQGKAQVKRAARTLLSPLTSQGRIAGATRSATAMTALERFKGDSPDARSAYAARRGLLTQAATNPQLVGEAMAMSMAELAREDPGNFVGLARRMTEALQYVANNLPATVAVSLAYPTGVPLTDSELKDVAELWNTAFEPETALASIEQRTASPVQMRTLRELHPDIYSDLTKEVIAQSPATFASLDSQTKLSIDIMFGSDGIGGLFATSEAARYIAEANRRAVKSPERTPGLQPRDQSASVEAAGIRAVRSGVTNRGVV